MLVISFGFCIFGQARVAGHYFAAAPGADHWDVESRPGDSAALPKKGRSTGPSIIMRNGSLSRSLKGFRELIMCNVE